MHAQVNRYQQFQRTTQSGQRAVAIILRRASAALHEAEIAIHSNDIEKRVQESAKASELISGLANIFRDEAGKNDQKSLEFADYLDTLVQLINRMNFKNEASTAKALADSLLKLASEWERVSAPQKSLSDAGSGFHVSNAAFTA